MINVNLNSNISVVVRSIILLMDIACTVLYRTVIIMRLLCFLVNVQYYCTGTGICTVVLYVLYTKSGEDGWRGLGSHKKPG